MTLLTSRKTIMEDIEVSNPRFTKFVKSEFARKKKQKQGDLDKITSNKVGINSGQGTKLCRKRIG